MEVSRDVQAQLLDWRNQRIVANKAANSEKRVINKPCPPILPDPPVCPRLMQVSDFDEIPEELVKLDSFFAENECAIDLVPLRFPVRDTRYPTHIYENKTIRRWLSENGTSPLNRKPMTVDHLEPHVELQKEIEQRLNAWVEKQNAPILDRHKEALRQHEKLVKVLLFNYEEALHEYQMSQGSQEDKIYHMSDGTVTDDFGKWHENNMIQRTKQMARDKGVRDPKILNRITKNTYVLSNGELTEDFFEWHKDNTIQSTKKEAISRGILDPNILNKITENTCILSDGTFTEDFFEWLKDNECQRYRPGDRYIRI